MAKKADYSNMTTTSTLEESLTKATSKRRSQTPASEEEQAERIAAGTTRGRKGCTKTEGKHRTTIMLDDSLYRFIAAFAKIRGISIGDVLEGIIEDYRESHQALYNDILALIERVEGGAE